MPAYRGFLVAVSTYRPTSVILSANDWRSRRSARFAYVGRSNLTFDDQTRAAMGGYVTGRLQVGMETGTLRVVGYVDNPANIYGDTFAFGNPFGFLFQKQSTPLRPRTAGLAISADF